MLEQLQSMAVPSFLLDPKTIQQARDAHNNATQTDDKTPWQDWSLKTSFTTGTLFLRAASWNPMPPIYDGFREKPLTFGARPDGRPRWKIVSRKLPKNTRLRLYQKAGDGPAKLGWAQFDGDIWVPILFRHGFEVEPIMSLTPNECISVKAGARFARGHVTITGLGLGYLLWLVSNKPGVKSVTLIEIDKDIVDTVMPLLRPHLKIEPAVIIGDCRKLLPEMKGDVVLMDHFDAYGHNSWFVEDKWTTGFARRWIWG